MKKIEDKFTVIIPARYASSRFPGKPLAVIAGKMMIERVYNRALDTTDNVYVATDDDRIRQAVESFGGKCIMTSPAHQSGTDRIREAVDKIGLTDGVVINVQGDEPFIDPSQIELLKECFANEDTELATLVRRFDPKMGFDALADPNLVKVTVGDDGNAIYFSRSVIPFVRGCETSEWISKVDFFTHIGIYAYRVETLREITELKRSSLEIAESLEQLRWIQAGYRIMTRVSDKPTIGIDTPADLERACRFASENNL